MDTQVSQSQPRSTPSSSEAEYFLSAVPTEEVQRSWAIVQPFIEQAVEGMGGSQTVPSFVQTVVTGHMQLWGVIRDGKLCALVGTDIGDEPSGQRVCNIRFCVGTHLGKWVHLLSELEAYARYNDCDKVATHARKGWTKYLSEYKLTHVLLERYLE